MHPRSVYRTLLVASVAVPVAAFAAELFAVPPLPTVLADFVRERDEADLAAKDIVLGIACMPLVIAAIWNLVALYRFRPAARGWAVAITVYALILVPFLGSQVQTWLTYTGDYVGSVCLGAVLIAGYCDPFKSLFVNRNTPPVLDSPNADG